MASLQYLAERESDLQRLEAAPLYLRLPAVLIDGLIVLGPAMVLGSSGELPTSFGATMGTLLVLLTLPATFLPGALLLALLEWRTGKSVGKLIAGIRVTGVEDGEPLGLIRTIGRRAFIMIEAYMLFIPSLILIPFNRNFDGHLGDRLTGAIVARDRDIVRAFEEMQGTSTARVAGRT